MAMRRRKPLRRASPTLLAGVIALLLLAAGPLADPTPAYAGTGARIEAKVLSLINAARERRGADPLRLRASLVDFAGDRAAKMASTGVLKHPKCLPCMLERRDIPYSTWGETIAWTLSVGHRSRTEDLQDLEEQRAPLGDPDEPELRPHRDRRRQTQQ